MNRRIEIIDHVKITRIFETDVDPPGECDCCGGITLWDADSEKRKYVDCGDERKVIRVKPRLAIAGRRHE